MALKALTLQKAELHSIFRLSAFRAPKHLGCKKIKTALNQILTESTSSSDESDSFFELIAAFSSGK